MRTSDEMIDRIYISQISRNAEYKMPAAHEHAYYELYYVKSGEVSLFSGRKVLTMKTGDYAVIPPGISHYAFYKNNCVRINVYFNFSDLTEDGIPFFTDIKETMNFSSGTITSAYRDELTAIFDRMMTEGRVNDRYSLMLTKLLLREAILYMMRYSVSRPGNEEDESGDVITDIVNYINENFALPLDLNTLSKQAGLSPSYFSKKFKAKTGMGMKEYVVLTRLRKASAELLSTGHKIADVAANCGFLDPNYFKDCFRKVYGMSPRDYRKAHVSDVKLMESLESIED